MDGSEPLEWSIDIDYCHWANVFMGCATLVEDGQYHQYVGIDAILRAVPPGTAAAAAC